MHALPSCTRPPRTHPPPHTLSGQVATNNPLFIPHAPHHMPQPPQSACRAPAGRRAPPAPRASTLQGAMPPAPTRRVWPAPWAQTPQAPARQGSRHAVSRHSVGDDMPALLQHARRGEHARRRARTRSGDAFPLSSIRIRTKSHHPKSASHRLMACPSLALTLTHHKEWLQSKGAALTPASRPLQTQCACAASARAHPST